jgi:hypothetical protein
VSWRLVSRFKRKRRTEALIPAVARGRWSTPEVFKRVNNAIMGEEWAMLTMVELPTRGCWEVSGNYKSDYLAFVVWVD